MLFDVKDIEIRERFCKDNNLSIKLFQSPYFEERLSLYRKHFYTEQAEEEFMKVFSTVNNVQEYFELYNKLKDDIISFLNENERMIFFSQKEDMNKFLIKNKNLPKTSIYKPSFDGKVMLSLDMKKANFTSLKLYDGAIVKNKETYEDFVREFTDCEYFTKSKYIRQVVFGNVNPKRQTTFSQYLMDKVLDRVSEILPVERVISFQVDELVFDLENLSREEILTIRDKIEDLVKAIKKELNIDLTLETFYLKKIEHTQGYVKKLFDKNGELPYVFKGFDSIELPFVLRKYLGEEIQESDLVFFYEGRLAKLLETPKIEL